MEGKENNVLDFHVWASNPRPFLLPAVVVVAGEGDEIEGGGEET